MNFLNSLLKDNGFRRDLLFIWGIASWLFTGHALFTLGDMNFIFLYIALFLTIIDILLIYVLEYRDTK